MLEIFILIWVGRTFSELAQTKGRSKAWVALGVGAWFGGELFGYLAGVMAGLELGAYLVAILFAGAGVGVAYMIVNSLSAVGAYAMEPAMEDLGGVDPAFQDPSNPFNPPRA